MSWNIKDSIKWKRKEKGHYEMFAWYIWKEPEIHAEIRKEKSWWRYCLWTWGSAKPQALAYSPEKFKTAKEVKKRVVDLILEGQPDLHARRFVR